jgi:hypothetical protein
LENKKYMVETSGNPFSVPFESWFFDLLYLDHNIVVCLNAAPESL